MIVELIASLALLQDTSAVSLTQVVGRALETHPSIAIARAARDKAGADLGQARAMRIPALGVNAQFNQFEYPNIVKPLHGLNLANPPLFDRSLVQSGLSLNWVAFDFGSRANYVRAEEALESAADIGVQAAEGKLLEGVVTAYSNVLTARETLSAQDQRISALRLESDRVHQEFEQGKAARLDELRVDAEQKRAEADRIATVAGMETAEHVLADFAGIPFAAIHDARLLPIALRDSSAAMDTTSALAAQVFDRARQTNPDIRALEERVRSANVAVTGIRATGYPELHLNGAYVDRGRLTGDYSPEWQLGLSVQYSVVGGSSHSSEVRQYEADAHTATEQLRLTQQTLSENVSRALSSLRQARSQVVALASAVDESDEVARIERLSLDVGSGTQTDYLQAEANALQARASFIQARHAEISATVTLARLTGDLSREWLARNLETP